MLALRSTVFRKEQGKIIDHSYLYTLPVQIFQTVHACYWHCLFLKSFFKLYISYYWKMQNWIITSYNHKALKTKLCLRITQHSYPKICLLYVLKTSVPSHKMTYRSSNTMTCEPTLPHGNYYQFPIKSELSLRILFNTTI